MTAGNASGINDGAAVVLLGDRAIGEREGIRPLARILASASVGVEPRLMGIGPQQAILRALQRAGIDLDEVGLIEINEAFAPQVLACLKLLGLDYEDPRVVTFHVRYRHRRRRPYSHGRLPGQPGRRFRGRPGCRRDPRSGAARRHRRRGRTGSDHGLRPARRPEAGPGP
ncbi:putative acetyl-CoA acetyltransferase, partial [Pseudomonas aeruginosa MPAO1/P1]